MQLRELALRAGDPLGDREVALSRQAHRWHRGGMRWFGWMVASMMGCVAHPTVHPEVHYVYVPREASTPHAEVVATWHERAATICGGESRYQVVSTLADRWSGSYRDGGRFDAGGGVMRVPAIRVDRWHAEGLVRCAAMPAEDDELAIAADTMSNDACAAGDAAACLRAANGRRAAGDEARAITFVAKACRAGEPTACIDVGGSLEADAEVELAADFYKHGCKLGDDAACEAFARARTALALRG